MKNATKHAEELKSLVKKLLKDGKPAPLPAPVEPVRALVKGTLAYDVPDTRVDEAMASIDKEFCDLNELRVSTELEVQELIGIKFPLIERRVAQIILALNHIFEKEHTLSLERLRELGKKDARQVLRDLPEVHPFAEAYVMLASFAAGAFPADESTLAYLKNEEVVEPDTTIEEAQKFLESTIKPEETWDAFCVVRAASLKFAEKSKKK